MLRTEGIKYYFLVAGRIRSYFFIAIGSEHTQSIITVTRKELINVAGRKMILTLYIYID